MSCSCGVIDSKVDFDLTLTCTLITGYELLFKIQKCEIIGISHGKQVIVSYQYWLRKVHVMLPELQVCVLAFVM